MEKINEFFNKLFNLIPGYIFGLIAFSIGFIGSTLALILSPEYKMWKYSISILGHATGGMYLRIGVIISGLVAIPFFIYLGRAVKEDNVNEVLRKITVGIGIFSSVNVSLSEIFTGVNNFIIMLHGIFALCSWIGYVAIFILFSVIMLKNSKFSKYNVYLGYVAAGILIFYLILFFVTNFCNLYVEICYEFGRGVYIIMPTLEWMVYFSVLFWILFNSGHLLYKKI